METQTITIQVAPQTALEAFLRVMADGAAHAPVLPPEANERSFYYEEQA